MSRMKTFGKYLILFLLFYAFTSIMSFALVKSNYAVIDEYNINCTTPTVTITEAKATKVGGYVVGRIKNEDSTVINEKYIKVDFISERGNKIISKYVRINSLESQKEMDFKVNFSAENIKTFNVELVEAKEVDAKMDKLKMEIFDIASTVLILLTAVKFLKWVL